MFIISTRLFNNDKLIIFWILIFKSNYYIWSNYHINWCIFFITDNFLVPWINIIFLENIFIFCINFVYLLDLDLRLIINFNYFVYLWLLEYKAFLCWGDCFRDREYNSRFNFKFKFSKKRLPKNGFFRLSLWTIAYFIIGLWNYIIGMLI